MGLHVEIPDEEPCADTGPSFRNRGPSAASGLVRGRDAGGRAPGNAAALPLRDREPEACPLHLSLRAVAARRLAAVSPAPTARHRGS